MSFSKKYFIIFLLIFAGCVSYTQPRFYLLTKKKENYKAVVLPLKNDTKKVTIARIVYRVLVCSLINSKSFDVVEEGEVRNFLIKENIFPGDFPSYDKLQKLKRITGANIVIGGDILEADDKHDDIKLALILWGRSIDMGKLLWTTYYVKKGEDYRKFFHYGKVFTLTELATNMVEDIIAIWEDKLKKI